jgi:hypothetical protein
MFFPLLGILRVTAPREEEDSSRQKGVRASAASPSQEKMGRQSCCGCWFVGLLSLVALGIALGGAHLYLFFRK